MTIKQLLSETCKETGPAWNTIGFVLGLSLLATGCAGTDGSMANAQPSNQECINLSVTGSNIPKRVCRTPGEWEALAEHDDEVADEYFRQTDQRQGIMEQGSGGPYSRGQ